jgi:hypothetical protein
MSFISDIRGVSESALNQLADRFQDLPRPLLAAIGAGDFAIERLAELREALTGAIEKRTAPAVADAKGRVEDVRGLAGDLPSKVQEVAGDVIESVQKFAADAPAKTQKLVAELPEKLSELRESLSPDQLKAAVDGYTHLAAAIYGSLAARGDKTWDKVVETAGHEAKVVNTTARAAAKTATKAVRNVAGRAASVATTADVRAGAAKASAVHSENASARRQSTAGKTATKPTATPRAATGTRRRAATTPKAAAPAPKPAVVVEENSPVPAVTDEPQG